MFVYSVSKKSAIRVGLLILALFAGVIIGVAAILTAIDVGAKSPQLPIYSVDRTDNKIALTFDCAWGNSNTDELLSILEKENVRATFFVTGEFCDKFPEDVRKISGAGHEIANHSDSHPHIKGMNINDLIADTRECGRKIEMLTGKPTNLYRGPYGEYDDVVISTIEGMGYKMIQWSVDSIDWQEPDAATIKKRILEKTVSGSILLFHNDLANTTEALPEILTELKKFGFEFSPVSEMIYYKDYHIDNTGKQIYQVNAMVENIGGNSREIQEVAAIIKANFTPEEIGEMSNGISLQTAQKLSRLLTNEQIKILSEAANEIDAAVSAMLPGVSMNIPEEYDYAADDNDEEVSALGGEDILSTLQKGEGAQAEADDALSVFAQSEDKITDILENDDSLSAMIGTDGQLSAILDSNSAIAAAAAINNEDLPANVKGEGSVLEQFKEMIK